MNMRLKSEKTPLDEANEVGWRNVFAKLEEFRKLEDDWDGDGSLAPPPEIIEASIRLAKRLKSTEPPPHVCPSVNGTMSFEWGTAERFRDIEVVSPTMVEETNGIRGERTASIVSRPIDE